MVILRLAPTLVIAALALTASPAAGQTADVSFAAGRVTITARETPLAAILDAWERRGGPQFVDAGRLPERPVSLRLVDVTEREALRVLLRSAAGYVAIPKAVPQPDASAYDRVFIMAGSGAARRRPSAAPPAANAAGRPGLPAAPPAQAGALAAEDLDDPDVSVELDEMDELELVETLRRRYQASGPATEDSANSIFRTQPDGSPVGSTPRPGMIIATEEPRERPNPVRRRARDR